MRKPPNKGLSKYRKGFPVKLSKDNILMLHITYAWLRSRGEDTTDLDHIIQVLPPPEDTKQIGWREKTRKKTFRIRGPEVGPLKKLMDRAAQLPFTSSGVFRARIADLDKLTTMDLMVDADRE